MSPLVSCLIINLSVLRGIISLSTIALNMLTSKNKYYFFRGHCVIIENTYPFNKLNRGYICIWASLVAQAVKNLPAVWETWVRSLGLEDPLEEGMATHSSVLAWKIPMERGAWWAIVHGVTKGGI